MNQPPPKSLVWLLRKVFPVQYWEEIEGDLAEDFQYNLHRYGKLKARWFYVLDIIKLVKLHFLLKKRTRSNTTFMNKLFYFHLKYGIRALSRQKLYQALNILTLTLGFSCFMLIFLFVFNQQQKDNFLADSDQIVRLDHSRQGVERRYIHTSMPSVLVSAFPELEHFARIAKSQIEVSVEGASASFPQTLITTDPGFLEIFELELIVGTPPVVKGQDVLIIESVANKLFGSTDVIGQSIKASVNSRSRDYAITGVIKDLPVNASFSSDLITLNTDKNPIPLSARAWRSALTYFKLAPETDPQALAIKIPALLQQHTEVESLIESSYHFSTFDEIKSTPTKSDRFLASVDGQSIFIFSIVGIVVLLLGIANYVNLLAALSLRRTQEMSIKKVMGASGRSLIIQQLTETTIICFVAMGLSGLLVVYLTPIMESYLEFPLKFTSNMLRWVALFMLGLPVLLTLFAVLYPAILMSKVRFSALLKGKVSHSPRSRLVRNGLLTLQFSISAFLIVGTLTFVKQLDFIRSHHNTDHVGEVLVLHGNLKDQHPQLRQGLMGLAEVDLVSISSVLPGPNDNRGAGIGNNDFERQFDIWFIDEHFQDMMGLEMRAGDYFHKDSRNKSTHVLINESLVDIANIEPLGAVTQGFSMESKIVGIVQDFSINSAKEEVEPAMFMQVSRLKELPRLSNILTKAAIRLKTSDFQTAIEKIETVWKATYPGQAFDIQFMDDRLDRMYTAELRMGQLFGAFTAVAILISCLGILGLLTYLIEVKMKELGIRKVLGARFFSQVRILTSNIWKVMLISNVIAFPLSYYFLQDWLNTFVHRTHISSGLFIATFVIFAGIVAFSALWQVLRLNRINPTEVLRSE